MGGSLALVVFGALEAVALILAERRAGVFFFLGITDLSTRYSGGTGWGGPVDIGVQASGLIKLPLAALTVGWSATSSGSLDSWSSSDEESDRSDDTKRSLTVKSFTSLAKEDSAKAEKRRFK